MDGRAFPQSTLARSGVFFGLTTSHRVLGIRTRRKVSATGPVVPRQKNDFGLAVRTAAGDAEISNSQYLGHVGRFHYRTLAQGPACGGKCVE